MSIRVDSNSDADDAYERVVGPVNSAVRPRYSGIATFARLPRVEDVADYDVAILGVPFDSGVSFRPGARFGPSAIREASRLLRPYNPILDIEPFAVQQVVDFGDLACNPFSIEESLKQIQDGVGEIIAGGRRLVTLGGDHTIALPILRAMAHEHGPVALLHFDAHLDTWDTYFGEPYTHGTPFRRAVEEGLLLRGRTTHVGIRGPLYGRSDLADDERLGFGIVSAMDVQQKGVPDTIDRIRAHVGDHPVYLSVDIDVLDPAHAPGTGTPEAGGLTSRELLAILHGLSGVNIVGADVVEVSPAYDHAAVTAVAAAHVAYAFTSLMGKRSVGDSDSTVGA